MSTAELIRSIRGALAVTACALVMASCADLARTGSGPAYLIMESVSGSRGGGSSSVFTSNLQSDVQTIVDVTVGGVTVPTATIFNDLGRATIRAEMKNSISLTTPSALNSVTLNRYRVRFRRTDGRNTEGVDVPYGFDGGTTMTIPIGSSAEVGFDLVRHQSKSEPPLRNLINGGGLRFITVIAEVTFYGADQAGNEVAVSGTIDIQFADFGDE
ncbi:MAG: hypothetical protein AB7P34_16995 [Vicinamibacterales bacterium]